MVPGFVVPGFGQGRQAVEGQFLGLKQHFGLFPVSQLFSQEQL
jgi:hypothetical protein